MNVMFVEDDPVIRRTLSRALIMRDIQVITAESAEIALTLWAPNRFDAVLSDIGLPGMDGVGLARQIRLTEQRADTQQPVRLIAITGEVLGAQTIADMHDVFDIVLRKPVKTDVIISALYGP